MAGSPRPRQSLEHGREATAELACRWFFYWLVQGTAHYGRFTEIERPRRVQHTWMSRSTGGEESTVTVTFTAKGDGTLMALLHTGLPDTDGGRGHEMGWNFFLKNFAETLEKGPGNSS